MSAELERLEKEATGIRNRLEILMHKRDALKLRLEEGKDVKVVKRKLKSVNNRIKRDMNKLRSNHKNRMRLEQN